MPFSCKPWLPLHELGAFAVLVDSPRVKAWDIPEAMKSKLAGRDALGTGWRNDPTLMRVPTLEKPAVGAAD